MPRADIDPGLNDAGMRQGQEFLQQPQFLHDLQRRGVHRVAAEIAQEFAMLLQHRHIHARRASINPSIKPAGPPPAITQMVERLSMSGNGS